jgi:hypothetical protein
MEQTNNGPEDLVTLATENGVLKGYFNRPLTVTTPPMVTSFPKLTQADLTKDQERGINSQDFNLDLTMTGATVSQLGFKALMDKYDDMLLEYVYENQGVLGKKGMTRDQVSFMQKRQFKTRINYKTNKQWPDAMAARTKGLRESTRMPRPVFDASQGPYLPDVVSGDIVSVVLLYLGPYSKPNNFFGNSWQLIGVQRLGHLERAETVDVEAQFQSFPPEAFPR